MEIKQYLDLAREKTGNISNRKLAKILNISYSSITQFESGVATPKTATVIKLAHFVGIPIEQALLDLCMWQSKENPEALQAYQNIKKSLTGFSALTSILLFLCNSSFFELLSNLYYVYFEKIKLRKINYLGVNRFVTLTIY